MYAGENHPLISSDVRKGYDLVFCDAVSFLTCISATCVAIAQLVSIGFDRDMTILKALLRIYGSMLGCSMVFIELDASIFRTFIVFQLWTYRGCYYLFVGLLLLAEDDRDYTNYSPVVKRIIEFSSVSCIFLALLYSLLGLLHVQELRNQKMATYIKVLSHLEVSSRYPALMIANVSCVVGSGDNSRHQSLPDRTAVNRN